MRLVFDIETNGFLETLDKVHSIVATNVETGATVSVHTEPAMRMLVKDLENADELIGHNIITFDIPALQKVYGFKPRGKITDTLVLSRLIFPDVRERDFANIKRNADFPKRYIGNHSLMAWGHRLGTLKDEYEGGFEEWSPEMQSYCEQDVRVTVELYNRLMSKEPDPRSVKLEHDVQHIIWRQENYGLGFDTNAARSLYSTLAGRRHVLERELADRFPPWVEREEFVPKRDNKTRGYKKGVPFFKEREVEFNPNSRDHIAAKLTERYGWKPKEFTPEGKPKIDETVLASLPYPEAPLLAEHFMLVKRLGQLGEGKQSWIASEKGGRIHGRVITNGAVTGRMTHRHPNMAQVPSTRAPYGKECRSLFIAGPGKRLVGCDADALELRCLAGYMALYDGGAYVDVILKGDKAAGTDMHSINARVLGCDRDTAKTWFYAFIYGAGNFKLGSILGKGAQAGAASRKRFLQSLPALAQLTERVADRAASRGFLLGLDGRRLAVRSSHSALNTLLQSAGAIFMKQALVILDEHLQDLYAGGYEFVANVHDEWQLEVNEEYADDIGKAAVQSIRDAGAHYDFKCPLDGNYTVGRTWADTH